MGIILFCRAFYFYFNYFVLTTISDRRRLAIAYFSDIYCLYFLILHHIKITSRSVFEMLFIFFCIWLVISQLFSSTDVHFWDLSPSFHSYHHCRSVLSSFSSGELPLSTSTRQSAPPSLSFCCILTVIVSLDLFHSDFYYLFSPLLWARVLSLSLLQVVTILRVGKGVIFLRDLILWELGEEVINSPSA